MAKILIVDDDVAFCASLSETLTDFGHIARVAESGQQARNLLGSEEFDLVFLDLRLPDTDGLKILQELKAGLENEELPVVILTAFANSANTIDAMKFGAFDHLSKPVGRKNVQEVIERALARNCASPGPPRVSGRTADDLIGSSPPMREVQKRIGLAASSRDATVLILGETGTGKELVARAIHRHSARAAKPFIPVNCASIPAELLESELFGHVRGAFTGAVQSRSGRFKEADGGTMFLDEIGDMSPPMQAKMLRVLQDKVVTPIGGSSSQTVDVRIVAATLHDLVAFVSEGKFREDLFYRLNVFTIALPPLRIRASDILVLAEHFLERANPAHPKIISADAARSLLEHSWPGNVRELENLVQNLDLTVRGRLINPSDLNFGKPATSVALEDLLQLDYNSAMAHLEKALFQKALRAADGNRTQAARQLGINRQLLYSKLKEHGLDG